MSKKRITLAEKFPELAKEWHPTKNDGLKPEDVTPYSDKRVWWIYPYDDPLSGKHFDFEWQAKVFSRSCGNKCPFLSGHAIWPGFNDLATRYPELAKQWHPTKNGELTPSNVTSGTGKKVWWYLPYDDPETGEHIDFEWEARIADRVNRMGCPYLSGQAVWPGFNDLATKHPELAKQWHPTKNGKLTPSNVTCRTAKKVWWYLPYDDPETGEHVDFEWQARIADRVNGIGCPYLSGHAAWPGFNDLASNYPELATEWHPTKNRKRTPDKVYKGEKRKSWWLCPKCGEAWQASVYDRIYERRICDGCKKRQKKEEFF